MLFAFAPKTRFAVFREFWSEINFEIPLAIKQRNNFLELLKDISLMDGAIKNQFHIAKLLFGFSSDITQQITPL